MGRVKILIAFLAVVCNVSGKGNNSVMRVFLLQNIVAIPTGYSIYSYIGGSPTIAANWVKIDPSSFLCMEAEGRPCRIRATPNGLHPGQSEINSLKNSGGGPSMNNYTISDVDPNVILTVEEIE